KRLAVADRGSTVIDATSGQVLRTNAPVDMPDPGFETRLAYSPDGRWMATRDGKTVQLWDADRDDSAPVRTFGHKGFVKSVAFSPDGWRLASISERGVVRIWDADSGQELGAFRLRDWDPEARHDSCLVAFSPDGQRLATVAGNGPFEIKLWDVGGSRAGR